MDIFELDKILQKALGINCHSYKDDELHSIMYGEIYKIKPTPQLPKIIISGFPKTLAGLLKSYFSNEYNVIQKVGENPRIVFVGFTDKQRDEIKKQMLSDFNSSLTLNAKGVA